MKRFVAFSIFLLLSIVLIVSCAEDPTAEVIDSLHKKITSLDTPQNLIAVSNHSGGSIDISWDKVESATFYAVEYANGSNYINSNRDFEKSNYSTSIVNGTQFSLTRFPNLNDKRYVFRVKAGYKDEDGNLIYSGTSNIVEGAVLNNIVSFSGVPNAERKVIFTYSLPQTSSLLIPGAKVASYSLKFESSQVGSENWTEAKENGETIDALETKLYRLTLVVNSENTASSVISVTGNLDKYPSSIEKSEIKLEPTANEDDHSKGAVVVSFESKGINEALKNEEVSLRFLIERRVKKDGTWSSYSKFVKEGFTDNEGMTTQVISTYLEANAISLMAYTEDTIEEHESGDGGYTITFSDPDVEANADYQYKLTPFYCFSNGSNYMPHELGTESEVVALPDSKINGFYLDSRTTEEVNQISNPYMKYTLNLSWNTLHNIGKGFYFVVYRHLLDSTEEHTIQEGSGDKYFVIKPKDGQLEYTLSDIIEIPLSDHHRHYYSYSIWLSNEPEIAALEGKSNTWEKSDVETEKKAYGDRLDIKDRNTGNTPDINLYDGKGTVNIMDEHSLQATPYKNNSSLAKSIKLTWKFDDEQLKTQNIINNWDKVSIVIVKNLDHNAPITVGCSDKAITEYIVENLEDGKDYQFTVHAEYDPGNEQEKIIYSTSNIADGRTLAVPQNLQATKNSQVVTVTWDPVDGASGYKLYYKTDPTGDFGDSIDVHNETTYEVDEVYLTPGTTYYMAVTAYDKNKNETDKTEPVEANILGSVPIIVTGYNDYITVRWDYIDGIDNYNVYIYDKADADSKEIGSVQTKNNFFTLRSSDKIIQELYKANKDPNNPSVYPLSQKYYFSVVPINKKGVFGKVGDKKEGHWYLPPVNIKATKGESVAGIQVSWEKIDDVIYDDEKYEFEIYGRIDKDHEWELIGFAPSENTYFNDRVNKEMEYTVAISYNLKSGPLQDVFSENDNEVDNLGYRLNPVSLLTGEDYEKDGLYSVFFAPVKKASAYVVNVEDRSESIIVYPETLNVTETEIKDGVAIYDTNNGKIRVYFNKPVFKTDIEVVASVKVKGYSNIDKKDIETNYVSTTIFPSRDETFTEIDIFNISNYLLNKYIAAANKSFDEDWVGTRAWGDAVHIENGTLFNGYNCSGTKRINRENGLLTLKSGTFNNYFEVSSDNKITIINNDNTSYLGRQDLKYIKGSFKFQINYRLFNTNNSGEKQVTEFTVTYDGNSGGYPVKGNGKGFVKITGGLKKDSENHEQVFNEAQVSSDSCNVKLDYANEEES